MVEKLNKLCLIFEVVALDLAESIHKLEALSIVEGIVNLERSRLHVIEALMEERINRFCKSWNQA